MSHNKPASNWFFTAKGHDDLDYDKEHIKWIRYAKETGKDGYQHLQGFFGLHKPRRLNGVKSLFADQTIHLEVRKGRIDQCVDYCNKENSFCHEYGDMPKSHAKAGSTRWDRARELVDLGRMNDIRSESYELWLRYGHKFFEDYNTQNPPRHHDDDLKHRNIWLYGPSGNGKTSLVYKTFDIRDIYVKNCNKWFDGYKGQKVIFVDEVQPSWIGLSALKTWADRYPFNPEVKNGHSGPIRPHHIIVCTQYTIEECTNGDKELRHALERRFEVCHIDEILKPFKRFNPFKYTVQDVLCPPTCKKRKINKLF